MRHNLFRATLIVTVFSVVGILLNLLSQLVIAYYFGASFERDAFFAASTVPNYIIAILSGSIGYVFIPRYIDILDKQSSKQANVFFGSLVSKYFVLLLIISALGIFFAQRIMLQTLPGFTQQQIELSTRLLIIIFPSIIFATLSNILFSLYQIEKKFLLPALAALLPPVTSVIFVLLFQKKIGISSLAYGTLAGNLLPMLCVFRKIFNKNFKFDIHNFSDEILLLIKFASPLLVMGLLIKSTTIFERMFASGMSTGSISYLGYGNQIIHILATVTSTGIVTTLFPLMSKAWSEKDHETLARFFTKGLRTILTITLPICAFLLVLGIPVIQLIFERGAFDHQTTIGVYWALVFIMGAFLFQSVGNFITQGFYFSNKTITLSIIGLVEVAVYILLGYFLSQKYSYIGLALALTLSRMVSFSLSIFLVRKLYIGLHRKKIIGDFMKILLATSAMALSIFLIYNYLQENIYILLIFSTLIGGSAYIGLILKFKNEEAIYFLNKVYINIITHFKK